MVADRRTAICETVLDLAAEGGNRAVTHGAVDRGLDLPKGSTSYYYRTRSDLLRAAIDHLAGRSRAAIESAASDPGAVELESVSDVIAGQLALLLGARRRDALARYALAPDAQQDAALARALATCLFSQPRATDLFVALGARDPGTAARDLISLLEGLLFDSIYGHRSLDMPATPDGAGRTEELRAPIRQLLAGWCRPASG